MVPTPRLTTPPTTASRRSQLPYYRRLASYFYNTWDDPRPAAAAGAAPSSEEAAGPAVVKREIISAGVNSMQASDKMIRESHSAARQLANRSRKKVLKMQTLEQRLSLLHAEIGALDEAAADKRATRTPAHRANPMHQPQALVEAAASDLNLDDK